MRPRALVVPGLNGSTLHLVQRTPPPPELPVLQLDATGDAQELATRLGRQVAQVDVLRRSTGQVPRVVRVIDGMSSRSSLGARKNKQEDPDALEAASLRVERLAQRVVEIARRTQATRPVCVSYRALVHEPAGALRAEVERQAEDACLGRVDPDAGLIPCVWRWAWFQALRGLDGLGDCDLLLVVGTPLLPLEALLLDALGLGLRPESKAKRAWSRDPDPVTGRRAWAWSCPVLADLERRRVGAELVQALGRGSRGRPCPGGLWLLSSAYVPLPWGSWVGTGSELGLEIEPEAWDRLQETDRDQSERDLCQVSGCPRWTVRVWRRSREVWG